MNHIFAKCGSIAFGLRGALQRVRCQCAAALRVAVTASAPRLPLHPVLRLYTRLASPRRIASGCSGA